MTKTQDIALIDVGNSKILFGILKDQHLKAIARFSHKEFLNKVSQGLLSTYPHIIVASVVPTFDDKLKAFSLPIDWVNYQNINGLSLHLESPEEVGADRLATALAAYQHFKQSCLVIDAGTALTFCYVDNNGGYQGGLIFPGPGIASKSLNDYTAKIPLIHVQKKAELMGKNTKDAVSIGLFKGYGHLIKGLISDYKTFDTQCKLVGTGAGLSLYEDNIHFDLIDDALILKGLQAHYLLKLEK